MGIPSVPSSTRINWGVHEPHAQTHSLTGGHRRGGLVQVNTSLDTPRVVVVAVSQSATYIKRELSFAAPQSHTPESNEYLMRSPDVKSVTNVVPVPA